jgi:hypothetical protein
MAPAQDMIGKITGVVVDANGAHIAAASVAITNFDTGEVIRSLATDHYDAPLLQVGTYLVLVTASGFAPKSVDHIQVEVSAALKIDISWQPHYQHNKAKA